MPSVETAVEEPIAPPQEDVVSSLASIAKAVFAGDDPGAKTESLQNLLDSLTAKVVGVSFEVFREEFDSVVRVLRNAYGQIARFVKGDFRQQASFYLGQLHALSEIAYRLGHQRVSREALELVARSETALKVLKMTAQHKSIGAGELARELKMEESNLSAACKPLVERELLRRDRFGRRVRYSPTPLTFAVVAELSRTMAGKNESEVAEPVLFLKTKARVTFQKIQEDKAQLKDFERVHVREVLNGCNWERKAAAEILGIEPPKLASLMRDLNLSETATASMRAGRDH